jgi:hypothetical protein
MIFSSIPRLIKGSKTEKPIGLPKASFPLRHCKAKDTQKFWLEVQEEAKATGTQPICLGKISDFEAQNEILENLQD